MIFRPVRVRVRDGTQAQSSPCLFQDQHRLLAAAESDEMAVAPFPRANAAALPACRYSSARRLKADRLRLDASGRDPIGDVALADLAACGERYLLDFKKEFWHVVF